MTKIVAGLYDGLLSILFILYSERSRNSKMVRLNNCNGREAHDIFVYIRMDTDKDNFI